MTQDLLERGREVLARQGFSVLLGTRLDHFEVGRAVLSLPLPSQAQFSQQHGFAHGGVVSYLADNALTYAGGSVLGNAVTLEYKINYLRPVTACDQLVAVATVLSQGRSQAVCRCEVYRETAGERSLCAAAQGTIYRVETPVETAAETSVVIRAGTAPDAS
jgi:uncharacterized protein (TIGR00369 family)